MANSWEYWVEQALSKLESLKLLRSLRPIHLSPLESSPIESHDFEFYGGLRQWDRASVEIEISEPTFHKWLQDIPSSGDDVVCSNGKANDGTVAFGGKFRKLLIFSGNDYLGLSSHPTVRKAAIKAAEKHGMGPRGSALICGYTNYHRLLESSLADLKKKEERPWWLLHCITLHRVYEFFHAFQKGSVSVLPGVMVYIGMGTSFLIWSFSANMAVMTTIASVGLLLAEGGKPKMDERIAIFSDALNHASIIDGIRLAERQGSVVSFVYRHCDMFHLNELLSGCSMKKKVVVTDSLFSMDGDFAPMAELVNLRSKHGFLLVIDDAHATLVCGRTGGGAAEKFNCESNVDICIGTLSKAAGCHGGFVASRKRWKQLIQSRGRSFIFSTSSPVPIAAAAHAAVIVARKETWRRKAIWNRVLEFRALTGISITSPIVSLVVGSEQKALEASRHLLESGYHVTAIRPPTVPANSCRLRIALSAAHTQDDLRKFVSALSNCINLQEIGFHCTSYSAKL